MVNVHATWMYLGDRISVGSTMEYFGRIGYTGATPDVYRPWQISFIYSYLVLLPASYPKRHQEELYTLCFQLFEWETTQGHSINKYMSLAKGSYYCHYLVKNETTPLLVQCIFLILLKYVNKQWYINATLRTLKDKICWTL